jgi:hypothetical protein
MNPINMYVSSDMYLTGASCHRGRQNEALATQRAPRNAAFEAFMLGCHVNAVFEAVSCKGYQTMHLHARAHALQGTLNGLQMELAQDSAQVTHGQPRRYES